MFSLKQNYEEHPIPGYCLAGFMCKPTGNKDDHKVKQITFLFPSTKSGFMQKEHLKIAGKELGMGGMQGWGA